MKKSFWTQLEKPFLVLAPMENVTDIVFREMIVRLGKPDVFFTEFTSTDGLCSEGFAWVSRQLAFTNAQRPIVAQIWGTDPEKYCKTAKLLVDMGFDGIDINMGCPDKNVIKHGSCGGLITNPSLAKEIIAATKEGAQHLPVSVKTRIGFHEIETKTWISFLLEQNIAALTIHGRTVAEQSRVPAHWDEIGKVVTMRNAMQKETVIIGNGDVVSREDAMEKHHAYHVDGIMIGRGIFHNPWLFNTQIQAKNIPTNEKLQILIDHIQLFNDTWEATRPFEVMKKFYKLYISDIPNAHNFRMQLMDLKTPEETIAFIRSKMN